MLLAATDYVRPSSVEEALAALRSNTGARVLAGGQTLINVLKHRAASVELLVDVSRLEELRFIDVRADGSATIGAASTYAELERSTPLREAQPLIGEVAAGAVDRQVRARGTIGGNACFADPASNYPPLLVALDASMEITLPPLHGAGVGYSSLQLAADSWALARAAAWVRVGAGAPGTVEAVRVVLGCVAATPVRASATEQLLSGAAASEAALAGAAAAAGEGLEPPSDVHASGTYRRAMAAVMAKRALLQAIGGAR
jgi:carbon-monoxide dehydrogenase medium subunit